MLSVIIVNFKNPALLRLCLTSLSRVLKKEMSHEVIVVDSQTSPETQSVVRDEFPNFILMPYKKNIGYTRGVNEGIKASSGEYILILNPDIVLLDGSVEAMLEYMKAHPDIGLLGPKLLNFDGTPQQSCFRFYSPLTIAYRRVGHLPFAQRVLGKFLMRDQDLSKTIPAEWLMGSAILARKSAIDKVGLMDEHLFLYMSDVDWARRFWENKYRVVYYPLVSLYHYHRRVSKGRFGMFDVFLRKETRWHIMDAFRYFWKHGLKTPSIVKYDATV